MSEGNEIVKQLRGRAQFLRDRLQIKSPQILERGADRIEKLQARARIAEQRERELIGLLRQADCPDCDGSGTVVWGDMENGDIEQCRWCHERESILAKHEQQP